MVTSDPFSACKPPTSIASGGGVPTTMRPRTGTAVGPRGRADEARMGLDRVPKTKSPHNRKNVAGFSLPGNPAHRPRRHILGRACRSAGMNGTIT